MAHLKEISKEERLRIDQTSRDKFAFIVNSNKQIAYEEGKQLGMEKGKQLGREEGKQLGKQQIILNMLKKKSDISFISEVTGWSAKEIKKLKNNLKEVL